MSVLKKARLEQSPTEDRAKKASTGFPYVKLNVGGCVFRTSKAVLTREPSQLEDWTKTNFSDLPKDSEGIPFIDRDPSNFRHILNYLRGYQLPQLAEDLIFLADDAEFFGLQSLQQLIGTRHALSCAFLPGAGVSQDGTELTSSSVTALCGAAFFSSGSHSITFRIEKCDMVGVGVVAKGFVPSQSQASFARSNCCCLFNTGEVVNYINDQSTASDNRYKEGDLVTVLADFDSDCSARIGFTKAGCGTYTVTLQKPVPDLRFAVFLHGSSVVQIVAATHSD